MASNFLKVDGEKQSDITVPYLKEMKKYLLLNLS